MCARVAAEDLGPCSAQRAARRGRRPLAVEIPVGHGHAAVDQVAQVVGEVGVVAAHEAVPGHVGVLVEGDLAQRHVARAVPAERRHHVAGLQEVAAALAHPLALGQQPAVDPDAAAAAAARRS